MQTKTIGELLRDERTAHRMSVAELSSRTRVRPEYLEALEGNIFSALPAATFVRGYIKAYAQVFGLDYRPLLGLLRRDYKESTQGQLIPRDFLKPVLKKRQLSTPITGAVIILAVIFSVILGYVGVQWYQLNQPPTLTVSSPTENQSVAAQVEVIGQTKPEATVKINDEPVALQPDGSFMSQIILPREGLNTITVEASDRQGKVRLVQRTVYVQF